MKNFAWASWAVVSLLVAAPFACATAVDQGLTAAAAGVGGSGEGGSGETTSTVGTSQSGVGGAGGTGGPPGPCVTAEDCSSVSDQCNVGTCINGVCEKVPANEAGSCDDGKECTLASSCQAGACTGTQLKSCPPSGPCS